MFYERNYLQNSYPPVGTFRNELFYVTGPWKLFEDCIACTQCTCCTNVAGQVMIAGHNNITKESNWLIRRLDWDRTRNGRQQKGRKKGVHSTSLAWLTDGRPDIDCGRHSYNVSHSRLLFVRHYLSDNATQRAERGRSTKLVQGGPSVRGRLFVDIKLKVPSQYELLMLKCNSYFNVNKRLTSTRWTTL